VTRQCMEYAFFAFCCRMSLHCQWIYKTQTARCGDYVKETWKAQLYTGMPHEQLTELLNFSLLNAT